MTPELFPEYFIDYRVFLERRKAAFKSGAHFIAISESTKRDLQRLFEIPDSRIRVIYHGAPEIETANNIVRRNDSLLYVGGRARYKNFQLLVSAMSRSSELASNVELVLFGGSELNRAELSSIEAAGIRRYRHISGDDKALARAYCEATALVYTSEYEGFGLPLLEAMACGCPVIAANSSSLPEVGSSAVVYFSPYDADELCQRVHLILSDGEMRRTLIARGLENVCRFKWHDSAVKHLGLYRELAALN